MSRKYYDIISMKSKEWDNKIDKYNHSSIKSYYDIVKQNYQLLLQIIDNKTDDEFYVFLRNIYIIFNLKNNILGLFII